MMTEQLIGFPGTPAILTTAAALTANIARLGFIIQNLKAEALYVRLGASGSITVFDFILPACTAADDGTSPAVLLRGYTGIVTVASVSGVHRYICNPHSAKAP